MNKIFSIGIIWVSIIFIYIIMAFLMPAMVEITEVSSAEMQASACMTELPGVLEAVESSPVWLWFIPGLVGIVSSVVILKRA